MRAMQRTWWTMGLLLLALVAAPAMAQRAEGSRATVQGIYDAEVPVNTQSVGDRNNGFARALIQVLAKLSGNNNPQLTPGLGPELRNAKDYVASYDYRQDEGVSSTGAPTFKTMLVVRFKPAMVDELTKKVGVPVWPNPRPKPVLWLAIDDGSGPRLVGLPQVNAARATLDRAKARGYSLGLPRGSAAEQAAAGAIWRGDTSAIARISQAYSPPMQLVGKLYRSGPAWRADWIFVDNGRVLSRTSSTDGDARRAMAAGADMAADALARKYARRTGPPPKPVEAPKPAAPEDITITFAGINSADAYLRLIGYLERHALVDRIVPVSANGDQVVFRLGVKGGLAAFAKSAETDGVLSGEVAPVSGDEKPAPASTYRLR